MKRKTIPKQQKQGKINRPLSTQPVSTEKWKIYSALAAILMISFLIYLPSLENGFLVWDDGSYIKNNLLIRSVNLKDIFSTYTMGNYHPLTILTLALEYKFFGLNPMGYHSINILLHLLNVLLVFYTIFLLSEKNGVALVAALLFGIHPLHVESVAWASELKDLLYTFYFLGSLIFYLKYLKKFQKKFLLLALLMFILSLLSKAMAASLPVVLILIDYFKGRRINFKSLLEKVPFFLLSIILGAVAVLAQKGAIQDIAQFSFSQRIIFACYGFISYLFKLVLPLNLSAFYPYPQIVNSGIPVQYYGSLLLFLVFAAGVLYSLRFSRKVFFGIAFFATTIFLVLQLLPVGAAIMADRYSYIPSIGIFYLAGEGLLYLWNKRMKTIGLLILSAFTIFYSLKTFSRNGVWINDLALWNDVISQDKTVAIAYNNRGTVFLDEKKDSLALDDFSKAIALNIKYYQAYYNRGIVLTNEKRNKEAIDDFTKAIEIKKDYAKAYEKRGALYIKENNFDQAKFDLDEALLLNPNFVMAYHNRGVLFYTEKKYEEAIKNYTKAIELNPGFAEAFYSRGIATYYAGKKDIACKDINEAIRLGYNPPPAVLKQICN